MELPKNKLPDATMTVIIRDDSPLVHCNDNPSYRVVRVELTPQQREATGLRWTYSGGGNDYYESISRVIIEVGEQATPTAGGDTP